jgi:hypothetical protein
MHPMDCFVKNTYEILSPLNAMTSRMAMTEHRFLTADRKVRLSVFGNGAEAVRVIVNGSPANYRIESRPDVTLPPYGFLIESPTFIAFCAISYGGMSYETPTCFTLRSNDGKPLVGPGTINIYHAFGSSKLKFRDTEMNIAKEGSVVFPQLPRPSFN